MTQQTQDVRALRGQDLISRDGDKLGTIEEIYLDTHTNQPEWALITTGLFGTKQSFVPISGASRDENGLSTRPRSRTPRRSIPTVACPTARSRSSTATTA